DQWTAGSPVFKSEVEQRERELNAQRAEARKSYNVAYPKFMDGGEKPPITPEKPPVVYLEKNEPPGMIIVDTGGRKLYYVLPGKRAYAYPISLGRGGLTWTGTQRVSRIAPLPSLTPPPPLRPPPPAP